MKYGHGLRLNAWHSSQYVENTRNLDCGQQDSPRNCAGNSALHWAAAKGHISYVRWLLQQGAPADAPNNAGRTPLHSAVLNKQPAAARTLVLEGHADVHKLDDDEQTPLQAAVAAGGADSEVAKELKLCAAAVALAVPGSDCGGTGRRSVKHMRALLAAAGEQAAGCTERQEMERRCDEVLASMPELRSEWRRAPAHVLQLLREHYQPEAAGALCPQSCKQWCSIVVPCTLSMDARRVPPASQKLVNWRCTTHVMNRAEATHCQLARQRVGRVCAHTIYSGKFSRAGCKEDADSSRQSTAHSPATSAQNGDAQRGQSPEGSTSASTCKAHAALVAGTECFKAGEFQRAALNYSLALRLLGAGAPQRATVLSNRSAAHAKLGRWEKALADAEAGVKIDHDGGSAKLLCRKGAALVGLGQAGEAVKVYKQAQKADPSYAGAAAGLQAAQEAIAAAERRYAEMWGSQG